jgi:DNA mismatch endonuclease (patch repair protein)
VFVDGCFWHACPEHGSVPKSNGAYWVPKLARNQERDEHIDRALLAAGWTVLRVWEHESVVDATEHIAEVTQGQGKSPFGRRDGNGVPVER